MKKMVALVVSLGALSSLGCARDAKPACGLPCVEAAHTGKLVQRAWGETERDVWAVGLAGSIAHYDGSTWSNVESGTRATLFGVWGSGSTDVWAVGANDTVLHFDGASWTASKTGSGSELHGVFGTGPSDVWAVGSGGAISHFDGKVWSARASHTSADLTAISGTKKGDVWAVGAGGTMLHLRDGEWQASVVSTRNLFDVWVSESSLWAVGYGAVLRFEGGAWREAEVPTGDFVSIVGNRDDDVWIAGFSDEVLHWDGARFDAHASGIGGFQALTAKWAFAADGRIVAWGHP